jgi:hypothetical protein
MKTIRVVIELKVSDDVADKYPNYSVNYDDVDEFVESLLENIETPFDLGDFEMAPISHYDYFGYAIRILNKDEVRLLEIDEDLH